MRELILDIIQRLSDEKKAKNIVPSAVLYTEISNALNEQIKPELNQLVKDKKITFHRTINDLSFEITKPTR